MSRTRKDRPYWVRGQDPKALRHASHHCGANAVRVQGKPIMREVGEWVYSRAAAKGEDLSGWVIEEIPSHRVYVEWGDDERWYYVKQKSWRYLMPSFEVLWVTEYVPCDIDTRVHSRLESYNKTCTYWAWDVHRYYDQTPGWWVHDQVTSPRRRRDRDVLGEAKKWQRADPDGFAEDFDLGYDEPHVPWYW